MRRQYINISDNKLYEIVEDEQNNLNKQDSAELIKLHRYNGQLDKLSKVTQETFNKNK